VRTDKLNVTQASVIRDVIRDPRDLPAHTPAIFLISLTCSAAAKAHQYASTDPASTKVSRVAILSLLSGGQALCNNHLELSGTGSCVSAGRALVAHLGRHQLRKRASLSRSWSGGRLHLDPTTPAVRYSPQWPGFELSEGSCYPR
jgi:hypothetical protein